MDPWIAEAVGIMHINKITQIEIAKEMNVTNDYVSMILLGKKKPKNAKERIMNAINKILSDRKSMQPTKS